MNKAYKEHVFSDAQQWEPISDKIAMLEAAALPASGSIIGSLMVKMKYHPILSSFIIAAQTWYSELGHAAGIRVMYVPTLEQLGFPSEGYSITAIPFAILGADDMDIDLRVLKVGTADVLSTKSETVPDLSAGEAAKDYRITMNSFTATPGSNYFIDVRQSDASAPAIALKKQELLLQIIKD